MLNMAADRNWKFIRFSSDVPSGCDVHLAVIEAKEVHALAFPCRRVGNSWVNALTGRPLEVYPTHWKDWCDASEPAAQFNRSPGIKIGLIAARQARRIFNIGLVRQAMRVPATAERREHTV
jgi:hypothetical protein